MSNPSVQGYLKKLRGYINKEEFHTSILSEIPAHLLDYYICNNKYSFVFPQATKCLKELVKNSYLRLLVNTL